MYSCFGCHDNWGLALYRHKSEMDSGAVKYGPQSLISPLISDKEVAEGSMVVPFKPLKPESRSLHPAAAFCTNYCRKLLTVSKPVLHKYRHQGKRG